MNRRRRCAECGQLVNAWWIQVDGEGKGWLGQHALLYRPGYQPRYLPSRALCIPCGDSRNAYASTNRIAELERQ